MVLSRDTNLNSLNKLIREQNIKNMGPPGIGYHTWYDTVDLALLFYLVDIRKNDINNSISRNIIL